MNYKKYSLSIAAAAILFVAIGALAYFNIGPNEDVLLEKYRKNPEYKQFIGMIENDRKDLANNPEEYKKAAATMDMGLAWYNLQEYGLAVKWWKKGLKIQPKNQIGWYNLGNAYRELRKYSKAESAYRESMKIARSGEIDGCLALAEMYHYLYTEKKDEEPNIYKKCLKKHINDRDLTARLAGYYRDNGDKKKALFYFDKLFSIDPSPGVSDELRQLGN